MAHPVMFAEDYLNFDAAEAEAEYRSALPIPTDFEPMTKAEMIEGNGGAVGDGGNAHPGSDCLAG